MIQLKKLSLILILLIVTVLSCGKVTQEVAESEKKEVKTFDLMFKLEVLRPEDSRFDKTSVLHKDERHVTKSRAILLDDELELTVAVQGIKENQGFKNLSWGSILIQKETAETEDEEPKITESLQALKTLSQQINTENVDVQTTVSTPNLTKKTEKSEGKDTKKTIIKFEQIAKNQHQLKIKKSNYNDTYIKLLAKAKENDIDKYRLDVKAIKIRYDYDAYFIKVFEDKDTYRLFSINKQTAEDNQSYTIGELTEYQTFINIIYLYTLQKNDFMLDESIVASYDMFNRLYTPEFFDSLGDYRFPKNTIDKFDDRLPSFRFKDSLINELSKIMEVMLSVSKEDAKTYIKNNKTLALSKVSKRMIMSRIDAFVLPDQTSKSDKESVQNDTPTKNTSISND